MSTEIESKGKTAEENTQSPVSSQVRIQFTSRSSEIDLPDDLAPILVPTELRRAGLSQIVNHLLGTTTPTPFAFLANGSFLRATVAEYLEQNGLSTEQTIPLEAVIARLPPPHTATFPHDDWIADVDVLSSTSPAGLVSKEPMASGQERIVTSSYDGILRFWDTNGRLLATSSRHRSGPVQSLKAVKYVDVSTIVTGGMDRVLRIFSHKEKDADGTVTLTPKLALYGHTAPINALSTSPSTSHILSASADHTVMLWSPSKTSSAPSASPSLLPTAFKRPHQKPRLDDCPSRGPLATLSTHTAPVSAAIFKPSDPSVAYTSSWDHTIATFDLTTSAVVSRRETTAALFTLCTLPTLNLLAAGSAARHVALVDVRSDGRDVIAPITLRGHRNIVTALAAEPGGGWGLVSSGNDGVVRLWDLRAVRDGKGGDGGSLIVKREETEGLEKGEGSKVFALCWDKAVGIVSGGEDKKLQINRRD